MSGIAVAALRGGEIVRTIAPFGSARIISIKPLPTSMVFTAIKGGDQRPGFVVEWEYIDGPERGRRCKYLFHPSDRFALAQ